MSLGATKHDPEEPVDETCEADCSGMPTYKVEQLQRWPDVLVPGEEVWVTEKLHGETGRFVHDGSRLWAGSAERMKKPMLGDPWRVAMLYGLDEKLANNPGLAIYGEMIGRKDLKYGFTGGNFLLRRGSLKASSRAQ